MNLNNIPIARRLWGAILVLLVAMLGIAGGTIWRANAIQAQSAAEIDMRQDVLAKTLLWQGLTDTAVTRGMAASISADNAVAELFKENLAKDAPRIAKLRQDLTAEATDADDQAVLKDIQKLGAQLVASSKKASEAKASGDVATAAATVRGEYAASALAYTSAIAKFGETQHAKANKAQADAAAARQQILAFGGLGAVVIIGLGMFVAAVLVRSIRVPLARSIEVAGAIAQGDLTRRIVSDRTDEFGELMKSLQNMNESLGRVVGNVRASTDSISTASTEIASGNADLSSRTEQTASNLQQTASSMEQLTGTVKQSADAARQANQLASSAAEVAARGGAKVSEVVHTMDEINASSKKIADIIGVIDGIAFQTNILA
ncbi:methyl-accepting chemotaxis protein, partial [Rhizobacter sp. Root1221]|uniref:methyl-accepting chemotaxis protein n=1 Tax=Rhizobacter sp. Root1221 TaxID=1736433 RepID=UPI001F17AEDA